MGEGNIMAYVQLERELATLEGDPHRVYDQNAETPLTDDDIVAMDKRFHREEVDQTVRMLRSLNQP